MTNLSHAQKRIYWERNGKYGTAVIVVCYCDTSIENYNRLFEEAKLSFPELMPDKVTAGRVSGSDRQVAGGTVIMFTVPGARRNVEGWENYNASSLFRLA